MKQTRNVNIVRQSVELKLLRLMKMNRYRVKHHGKS